MENQQFNAFVVEERGGSFTGEVKRRSIEDLPAGDLLVRVAYSSLNYKDALSASGNRGVTRNYPHTPGIDAAGTVVESGNPDFHAGDKVIVTGFDLGMNTAGGFGEYIRVPPEWAVALPQDLSMKEAMIYGTAGLTAGISVSRLAAYVQPGDGKVIVSGATGGVGSLCVSILSKLGYSVTAVTGKGSEQEFLVNLGAKEIIPRKEFEHPDRKPLLPSAYAGGVDTVGGVILENIIKSTAARGAVACCGNVASPNLELTVYPFILRGVVLIGIDSQHDPPADREIIWEKLSRDWKPPGFMDLFTEITLEELPAHIDQMLQGKLKGRTILRLGD